MSRLSSPLESMKDHYTAVVIGSGYGGGIAASRLARAGRSVCLLERGREIRPGEYPEHVHEAGSEMQLNTPAGHVGSRLGMFELHVNEDMNALVGCGLGGTSLINANVSLRADPRVFDDPRWPRVFRDDLDTRVEEGYRRAQEMLRPVPYPHPELPAKTRAHRKSAEELGMADHWHLTPINVTWEDGANHVGVEQKACIECGDCVSGCNHHAKNTTLMNYLPDAWNHGAEIFTRCSVRRIQRTGDRWTVWFDRMGVGREGFGDPDMSVTADIVVLAAGTLGSTEILLRSREHGLDVSDHVGRHFSGNGDLLGFGYNAGVEVNAIGFGAKDPDAMEKVGPCITSVIDLRDSEVMEEGFVMEEGSIPGPLAIIQPLAQGGAAGPFGRGGARTLGDAVKGLAREAESYLAGAYKGAVHNSQVYLVMAHDSSEGTLRLEDDRLRIDWPGVGEEPVFRRVDDTLGDVANAIGARYIENPVWSRLFKKELVTVHNLGGCAMAEDASGGVVDHKGRVFKGSEGTEVHDGLYVADGSVIPRSVGVNPLLTISAVAERSMALLAEDRGWEIDYTLPSAPTRPVPEARRGLRFTETMKGWFSLNETEDYAEGARKGQAEASPMSFTLTIVSADLDAMVEDPDHRARMFGTLTAPMLSLDPITVRDGTFQLFVEDPDAVDTWNMVYSMTLPMPDGETRYFHGYKLVNDQLPTKTWPQTSTLYVTVHDGDDDSAPVLGKGVLHIPPLDFLKQMTTMRVTGAGSRTEELDGLARFGKLFAGTLFQAYGGVLAPSSVFDPDAPPRKRRPLHAPPPEVHPVTTADGTAIRLTRYDGGERGPVLLAHGAGYSSRVFSTDLPNVNLVEFLTGHGFDVWLLDYRASTALPTAARATDGDTVAAQDWPAAVARVREVTGADEVQLFVHCFGSQTALMALAEGMEGVRSVVCSQVGLHPLVPGRSRLAAALHLPAVLEKLGVESLDAYTDDETRGAGRLVDDLLELIPTEKDEACRSAVCRRVVAMYGLPYRHENLTARIHDHLHELFGVVSLELLDHVSRMARAGHLVGADGGDRYMDRLDRLALPIHFIQGSENRIYLPEGTRRTVTALARANGADLYGRDVVKGYGHLDSIFGARASEDVYPRILDALEAHG